MQPYRTAALAGLFALVAGAAVAQAPPPRELEVAASRLVLTLIPARSAKPLRVSSPAFKAMGDIPFENTQYRGNVFPGLNWSKGPKGTAAYAVILQDTDALNNGEAILHWTMYNVPAKLRSLPPGTTAPPAGASFGPNVRGPNYPYTGPRTGPGPKHRYHFQVYALDRPLDANPAMTFDQLKAGMTGHVLASGQIVGLGQFDPTAPPPTPRPAS